MLNFIKDGFHRLSYHPHKLPELELHSQVTRIYVTKCISYTYKIVLASQSMKI